MQPSANGALDLFHTLIEKYQQTVSKISSFNSLVRDQRLAYHSVIFMYVTKEAKDQDIWLVSKAIFVSSNCIVCTGSFTQRQG